MLFFQLIISGVVFLVAQSIIVDENEQRRGGFGGRFADMPSIPVVGLSEIDEAFNRGNFSYVTSNATLYHSDLGDFIIVLSDDYKNALEDFLSDSAFILPAIIIYLLAIVILANILLAKYITRRIMAPINTLATGVEEIANGNLTHRINYNGGDEFDAVCSDFDEMAKRLSAMVEQRQADEDSRKELIAGISHDLRTPLTSVKAYIEGLRKGVATTPEMQEKYLSIIQTKTEDIEYIIKQLFLFSKIDIGEFPFNLETIDIGNLLAAMINGFANEYKEAGLKVSLEESTQGEFVLIDTVQFKNIVQNILGNSVKYCNRNDACAKIYCKKIDDGFVSITITDNGPGVPDGMITRMFDVFYRGDESRNNPGSGLGLAISSKIIKRLNGFIQAENVTGGGLSIIITLPTQKRV